MKNILCFGDSNTWGYMAGQGERFASEVRWTGVMAGILGPSFHIIEEGQNGRTTAWDDPIEGEKNGKKYLVPCLESHKPLDLVILMLGTNDLKHRFGLSAWDIATAAGVLVGIVQSSGAGPGCSAPRVLLAAPPPLGKLTALAEMFAGGGETSLGFSAQFKRVADEYGCDFIDLRGIVAPVDLDGVHYDAAGHHRIGEMMAQNVLEILFAPFVIGERR